MPKEKDRVAEEVVFFRGPAGINERIEAAAGKQPKASWLRDAVDEKIERDSRRAHRSPIGRAGRRR